MSTILVVIGSAFVSVGLTCGLLGLLHQLERGVEFYWACLAAADFSWMIAAMLNGVAWEAGMWGVFGAAATWSWWDHHRRNRDRRKVREALGAKSKALRDALVRKVRESAKPRPVPASSSGWYPVRHVLAAAVLAVVVAGVAAGRRRECRTCEARRWSAR